MEIVGFVLLVAAVILAIPVMAILALINTHANRDRINRLDRRIEQLGDRLSRMRDTVVDEADAAPNVPPDTISAAAKSEPPSLPEPEMAESAPVSELPAAPGAFEPTARAVSYTHLTLPTN